MYMCHKRSAEVKKIKGSVAVPYLKEAKVFLI